MNAKEIMPPHKEQSGWVYVRVRRLTGFYRGFFTSFCRQLTGAFNYGDKYPTERIISSRRVEHDVETGDFLRVCAEEGLGADFYQGNWIVWGLDCRKSPWSPTLRQAYFRYRAATER